MSLIKSFIILIFTTTFVGQVSAENMKKMGTHKDWETYVMNDEKGKVCFTQSKPVLQSPKSNPREARLFVSFRPGENIINEISITAGYDFNKKNIVTVVSGKNKYKFDLMQDGFAWMTSKKLEKKMYDHATNLEFEDASRIRDEMKKIKDFVFHLVNT